MKLVLEPHNDMKLTFRAFGNLRVSFLDPEVPPVAVAALEASLTEPLAFDVTVGLVADGVNPVLIQAESSRERVSHEQ